MTVDVLEEVKDLQQQKLTMRYAFVAAPGMLWASCDFKAQEARNVAAVCGDPNMAKIYILEKAYLEGSIPKPLDPNGVAYEDPNTDIHIIAASNINAEVKRLLRDEPWNCDHNKSALVAKIRKLGKIYNFGLIYLATARTLSEQTGTSLEEAQKNLEAYFAYPDGFWKLGLWLKVQAAMGSERRWTRTIAGDFLFCNEANAKGVDASNAAQRKAVNAQIQGLSSTQTKLALIKCQPKFDALNFKYRTALNGREGRILAPVHDEINAVIPGNCPIIQKLDDKGYTVYIAPKLKDLDDNDPEQALAKEYGMALENSMVEGQQYTFDRYLNTEIPAGAEIAIHKYWKH